MEKIEKIKAKIEDLDFDRVKIQVYKANPYRKEKDGRIITFSPLTGRICVMNPTLAFIYERVVNSNGMSFSEILEKLSERYNVSSNILKQDLRGALIWLLLNGFVELRDHAKVLNLQNLLGEVN